MRYSILGFNQEKILQIQTDNLKLDMNDLLLMNYIQTALSNPNMIKEFENNQPYVWLCHKKILEDLPILNIKESMLKKRIAKLVELELITSLNIANKNGRGSRAYYTITEKFVSLQFDNTEYEERPSVKNYTCSERPSVKNYTSNNKLNNNDNKLDKVLSKDNTTEFLGSAKKTEKKQKENLYTKCINLINDFTDDEILKEYLVEFLKMLLENSRESGYKLYTNSFKGKLRKLKELSDDSYTQRKIVLKTLDNGWNGFYELKDNKKTKNVARDIEQLDGYVMKQGNKNKLRRAIEDGTTEQF